MRSAFDVYSMVILGPAAPIALTDIPVNTGAISKGLLLFGPSQPTDHSEPKGSLGDSVSKADGYSSRDCDNPGYQSADQPESSS